MAYLGNSPEQNIRRKFQFTATASQTVFTGADDNGHTLKYQDATYVDVYLNGVLLKSGEDYTTSGKTTVTLTSGASLNDILEIVAYGIFSVADTVSASLGGTFSSDVTFTSNVSVKGNLTVGTGTTTITNNSISTTNVSAQIVSVGGSAVSPVQSFRNKIINGNFDFWQRGTSVSGVANLQYVADRWRNFRVGTTADVSRQSFTLGQTDVPNEPSYFHRTVVSSVSGTGNAYLQTQIIESVRTLAGQKATLSFWAKADASKNMAVEFGQVFGSGGSPSSAVNAIGVTTCALTTSWQKFEITVDVPSISGKTLGTNNNDYLALIFWFDAGSDYNSRTNSLGQQSGTFDIAQVQLEAGSVATPFEVRPAGVELALCQRYYQGNKSDGSEGDYGSLVARGAATVAGTHYYWMPFSTIMRAVPTMSVGSAAYSNASTAQFFNAKRHGAEISVNITSINGYAFVPWSASAEL